MRKRSSPPQQHLGAKRLRQQQLQSRGSSLDTSVEKRQRFWPCPVCNRSFALFRLQEHVNQCLDISPCPPTSPLTIKGDVSCRPPAVELYLGTIPGSGDGRGECRDVQTSPPSSGFSVSSVKGHKFPVKETKQLSFADSDTSRAFCDTKVEVVQCSGLQRPVTRQRDAYSLRAERCLSQEDNLTQEPPTENVEDGGRGGASSVEDEEDGGNGQVECRLEYSGGSPHRDDGNTDLWAENAGTEEYTKDERGLEEKGMAEEWMDGNGLAVDRPPAGFKLFQRQAQSQARLSMFRNFSSAPLQRKPSVTVLQPGMVLFRSWLDLDTQQKFVQESQGVAHLFHRPTTSGGGKYHIYSMCWGFKWDAKAHRYVTKGPEHPIPPWMLELSQKLAQDAQQHTSVHPVDSTYAPDVGLVNFYPVKADELGVIGLGGHQDLDDSGLMPVVSVSVGDSMTFFYRRFPPFIRRKSGISISVDEEAVRSCEDGDAAHNREHQILLESGDVLVFGGKSRLVYHGTRHVQPGTRPPGLHMVPGRLNFTFRQTMAKAI